VAPATVGVNNVILFPVPLHTGLLLVALATGDGFTVTLTDEDAVHVPTATTTVYVPDITAVEEAMVGSSAEEVKPLGPVQE
jgi:hypothetical protein